MVCGVGLGWCWAYLELVLKDVLLGGHLAVEAQQALLLWAQGLGNC